MSGDRDVETLVAAIEARRRALDADPDSADLHAALARDLLELSIHPDFDVDDEAGVIGDNGQVELVAALHLSRACGLRPDDPVLRTDLSDVLHELHAYDTQAAELSRALRTAPDDPGLLVELSHALGHHPRTRDRALAALRRALELAPDDRAVLHHMAANGPRFGAQDEAVTAARRLMRVAEDDEDRGEAFGMLGAALAASGRVDEALDALEEAHALLPGAGYQSQRAELLADAGRLEEAVDAYLAEAAADPEDGYARRDAAEILVRLGRLDEAGELFEQAEEQSPGSVTAEWATALIEAGRRQEAITALRRAVSQAPTAVETRRLLAEVLEAEGRHAEAAYESAQADALETFPPGDW
ncbi:MAG: tetratricopeptide repeat protein [Thermoleophilia bacterium]|nr:tetratricopeptide repeat protein [Thermoleophilia bacterium]